MYFFCKIYKVDDGVESEAGDDKDRMKMSHNEYTRVHEVEYSIHIYSYLDFEGPVIQLISVILDLGSSVEDKGA